jgi:predicted dehydrogenase
MGLISRFYVDALALNRRAVLTAVCDTADVRLAPHRKTGLAAYRSYHDLLDDPKIDAVVITLPNDLHFAACRDALRAGKHVCCEKPLTLDVEEAEELVRLSHAAGRTLLTAFHRRYNANLLEVLAQVPSPDAVSRVRAAYLERIEEHTGDDLWYLNPQRSGGGCIADNGPNVFDTLSVFLGRLHVESAEITHERDGVDLKARIRLVNGEGVRADVHLDWAYPKGEQKDVVLRLRDGRRLRADLLAGFRDFKSSLAHEYRGILYDFLEVIRSGDVHGEAGADAVRLVRDAYAAARRPLEVRT